MMAGGARSGESSTEPIEPPRGMTPAARQIWVEIMEHTPPDRFTRADLEMLRAYCEAAALHKLATREIKRQGPVVHVNGASKENPYVAVQHRCIGQMAQLATKLWRTKPTKNESMKPKSKRAGLLFGE